MGDRLGSPQGAVSFLYFACFPLEVPLGVFLGVPRSVSLGVPRGVPLGGSFGVSEFRNAR